MNENIFNRVPYLRTSRNFPLDIGQLTVELSKSYLDIASAVNARSIGIFSSTSPSITGDRYYLQAFTDPETQQNLPSNTNQSLRQIYQFFGAGTIPHGLLLANIFSFSPRCYGTYTDGTNWYGAFFGSNATTASQVSFYVDPVNINILVGASAPSITQGLIVLEWLSPV